MARPTKLPSTRVHTGDYKLDFIQKNMEQSKRLTNACPFLVGYLATVALVISTPTAVNHHLGRQWKGYIVLRTIGAFGLLYDAAQGGVDQTRQVVLESTTSTSYLVWFF